MENKNKHPILSDKMYELIEQDVCKLHIDLELSIPVDVYQVAEKLGISVHYYSEIDKNIDVLEMMRFSEDGTRRDGLSYYDPSEKAYSIWVNDIDILSFRREEFTIMHEIGHIRLKHKEDSKIAEMMANYYAGYALVPSPLVDMYYCYTPDDISTVFKVSKACAEISCNRFCNWSMHRNVKKNYEENLVDYYETEKEKHIMIIEN